MTIHLQFERQVEAGTIQRVDQDTVHFATPTAAYRVSRRKVQRWRGQYVAASRDCLPA